MFPTSHSLTNTVFKDYLRKFILIFFDDILIYSRSWEDHLFHVTVTLSALRTQKLFVKMEKCQFGQEQVNYLGHVISKHGVAVDNDKISAMLEWPKPTTLKALRGFIGLTGYYHKFIQGYGKLAGPLTSMLKKDSFFWNLEAETAFWTIEACHDSIPGLSTPKFFEWIRCSMRRFWVRYWGSITSRPPPNCIL